MILNAHAKINISLDVTGILPNGYHEVCMIMQTVSLCDRLTVEKSSVPGIHLTVAGSDLPADESNLAYRAADMLMKEFSVEEGVSIALEKRIPMAAGMAGGSTDAAAVFYGVNELFGLGLTREELMERAVKLGADIPYCLLGGTALAEGIGEKLTRLKDMPLCPVLIAKPAIDVPTGGVYKKLDAIEMTEAMHPKTKILLDGIEQGNLVQIAENMGNVLELVTAAENPIIEDIKANMKENGAVGSMMSGSGPTVFGLFDSDEVMQAAALKLKESGLAKEIFTERIFCGGEDVFHG